CRLAPPPRIPGDDGPFEEPRGGGREGEGAGSRAVRYACLAAGARRTSATVPVSLADVRRTAPQLPRRLSTRLPLSVLDLVHIAAGYGSREALRASVNLARTTEALGFTRYWFAEHHGMPSIASSAPEVLIGHIASATERIRVGSGGIMLP